MEWFQFGSMRTIVMQHNTIKEVGEYALHVQCAWRISTSNGIYVGSQDRYTPLETYSADIDDFDWDQPGANRCDERISQLFDEPRSPLVVQSIAVESRGGVCIMLSGGFSLEIFPDISTDDECWRLFQPYEDSDHFILTGCGIER
jgi:hypothetical protein